MRIGNIGEVDKIFLSKDGKKYNVDHIYLAKNDKLYLIFPNVVKLIYDTGYESSQTITVDPNIDIPGEIDYENFDDLLD